MTMEKQLVKYLLIVNFESGIKVYKFFEFDSAAECYRDAKKSRLNATLIDTDGNILCIN